MPAFLSPSPPSPPLPPAPQSFRAPSGRPQPTVRAPVPPQGPAEALARIAVLGYN